MNAGFWLDACAAHYPATGVMSIGADTTTPPLVIRRLGLQDYRPVWEAMQGFSASRSAQTPDELWLLEHTPVFTLGLNGKVRHLKSPGEIPVIEVDRGGQVTYHGPGQIIAYALLDLRRRGRGVRWVINALEQAVIDLLTNYDIAAERRPDAPGVYVRGAKIAALGLRVRQGRCYHGLSLNVAMDLLPFQCIDPCGYPDLAVTQLAIRQPTITLPEVTAALAVRISDCLG